MTAGSRTFAQRMAMGLGVFFIVFGIIGLVLNPDFGTGTALTSKQFVIDWNGWHAVSSIFLGATAIVAASRPLWAVIFLPANAAANVVESVWAVFDATPLGLLSFPNVATDLALHLLVAAVSLAAFVVQRARDQRVHSEPGSAHPA